MLIGVMAALIAPAVAALAAYFLRYTETIVNRPALPFLCAVAVNLVLIRFTLKKGNDQTSRGIMLATFTIMLLLFIFQIHPIR